MARGAYDGLFAAGQALTNAATGYSNYQTGQEDRAIALQNNSLNQQLTQQQIDAAQLANDEKRNAAANDAQLAQDTQAVYASEQSSARQAQQANANPFGLTQVPRNPTANPVAGQQLVSAAAPSAAGGVQAGSSPAMTAPRGGLPNTQTGVAGGATPTPFQAALMHVESNGIASATSAKGATGTMQTMPDTLRNPGFGVAPARDDSPAEKQRVGMDYAAAMQKRYGNDTDAAVAYNAGPLVADKWIANGRKPEDLPAETRSYVQQVGKTLQSQNQAQQGTQLAQAALTQPSPADQIAARESAGVDVTPAQSTQAVSAQDQHVQFTRKIAQMALQRGDVKTFQALTSKADDEEGKALDLRMKSLNIREAGNKEVINQLANVTDQASYDTALSSIGQNPDTANIVRGLGATGNFEADRHLIETMRSRGETVAEQNKNKIAQEQLALAKAKDDREQAKIDGPKIQIAQQQQAAQQQDQQRREAAQKTGMPFVPSIAASVGPGAKPADVQSARKTNDAAWAARDKVYATADHVQPQVMGEYANLYRIATEHPEALGGALIGPRMWAAQHGIVNTVDKNTIEFDKSSNNLALLKQQTENPAGARSMATAAQNANIQKTKPQFTMEPAEAARLAEEGYIKSGREVEHAKFLSGFRETNPDASPQVADTYWRHYEMSFPDTIRDPKTGEMVANTALVPVLPNGLKNDHYVSYADWRKAGAK